MLTQDGDDDDEEEEKGFLNRILSWLPWWKDSKELLGQGLAKQVGNVTECALLGLLVELGECVCVCVRACVCGRVKLHAYIQRRYICACVLHVWWCACYRPISLFRSKSTLYIVYQLRTAIHELGR